MSEILRTRRGGERAVRNSSRVSLITPHACTARHSASFLGTSIAGTATPRVPKVLEFYGTKVPMQPKINSKLRVFVTGFGEFKPSLRPAAGQKESFQPPATPHGSRHPGHASTRPVPGCAVTASPRSAPARSPARRRSRRGAAGAPPTPPPAAAAAAATEGSLPSPGSAATGGAATGTGMGTGSGMWTRTGSGATDPEQGPGPETRTGSRDRDGNPNRERRH